MPILVRYNANIYHGMVHTFVKVGIDHTKMAKFALIKIRPYLSLINSKLF